MTPSEVNEVLRKLDERTRRTQLDVAFIRSRLDHLSVKVAALAGAVATIVSVLASL